MTVVLAIISILSLISVVALLANSNYQRLNQSVEQIVTLVRTAQNRAEAITMDPNLPIGSATKAWEFKIDQNGNYSIIPLDLSSDGSHLVEQTIISSQDQGSLPAGAAAPVVGLNGNDGSNLQGQNTFSVVFTSPFGRAYIAPGYVFTNDQSDNCGWKDGGADGTKPAKDWYFSSSCAVTEAYNPSNPGNATIVLAYKNNTVTITMNSNGDISYQ
jgi:Tfp pilus assembly protein FimT